MSSSEQTEPLDKQMAPWICEACAHFMVLVVGRTTSSSPCPQSNRGHRLIHYTGTEQAVALRQEREARSHDQQTDKAHISR